MGTDESSPSIRFGDDTASARSFPDNGAKVPVTPPPRLGQHTSEVLGDWLGWDADRVERFERERVGRKRDKS